MEKGSNLQPNGPEPRKRPALLDRNASAAEITVAVCKAVASLGSSSFFPVSRSCHSPEQKPKLCNRSFGAEGLYCNHYDRTFNGRQDQEGVLGEWTCYWFFTAAHVRALFSSTELKQGI